MAGMSKNGHRLVDGMVEVVLDVDGWRLLQRPMVDAEWCSFVLRDTAHETPGDRKPTHHLGHNGVRMATGSYTDEMFIAQPELAAAVEAAMIARVFALTIDRD